MLLITTKKQPPNHDAGQDLAVLQEWYQHLWTVKQQLRQQVQELEEQSFLGMKRKVAAAVENARLKHEIDAWQDVQREQILQKLPQKQQLTQNAAVSTKAPGEKASDDSLGSLREAKPKQKPTGSPARRQNKEKGTCLPLDNKKFSSRTSTKRTNKKSATKEVTEAPKSSSGQRWNIDNSVSFLTYACPVIGCKKKLYLDPKQNLPLDSDGTISDQVSWLGRGEYGEQKASHMRTHMKTAHPNVPVANWPPGIVAKKQVVQSGYQSDTEEEEFV